MGKAYTSKEYRKFNALLDDLSSYRIPIGGYIPISCEDSIREILARYRPLIRTQGTRLSPRDRRAKFEQLVCILKKDYCAALDCLEYFEKRQQVPLMNGNPSLEQQVALPPSRPVDIERVFGVEAEELGYCGCVSWSRIRQPTQGAK